MIDVIKFTLKLKHMFVENKYNCFSFSIGSESHLRNKKNDDIRDSPLSKLVKYFQPHEGKRRDTFFKIFCMGVFLRSNAPYKLSFLHQSFVCLVFLLPLFKPNKNSANSHHIVLS